MKNFVVVYLVLVLVLSVCATSAAEESSPFTLAERIGEPNARTFFLFSTSMGAYAIRQDGMGEVTLPRGMRKVLYLKVGARTRIERLYFLEYEGDLLLLYEVSDRSSRSGYLVRLDQKKRQVRWMRAVNNSFEPPIIKDQRVLFNDGTVVALN